jgi:hypothetical protein
MGASSLRMFIFIEIPNGDGAPTEGRPTNLMVG